MVQKLLLLELILASSFALTGCQSGMEAESNTADTVFSAVTESGAAPSKESEPTDNDENADESEPASGTAIKSSAAPSKGYAPVNNDKEANESEPVSNAAAKPSVLQIENEIGTNQPGQTVSNLKITAEGAPVII